MKWLIAVMFLLGVGYAWFSFYEPTPSGNSMQGVMNEFQNALMRGDVPKMRSLCAPEAQEDAARLVQTIREAEQSTRSRLATIGSIGFDYVRGRNRVEGQLMARSNEGDDLLTSIIAVEQPAEGAPWRIVTIR